MLFEEYMLQYMKSKIFEFQLFWKSTYQLYRSGTSRINFDVEQWGFQNI